MLLSEHAHVEGGEQRQLVTTILEEFSGLVALQ